MVFGAGGGNGLEFRTVGQGLRVDKLEPITTSAATALAFLQPHPVHVHGFFVLKQNKEIGNLSHTLRHREFFVLLAVAVRNNFKVVQILKEC